MTRRRKRRHRDQLYEALGLAQVAAFPDHPRVNEVLMERDDPHRQQEVPSLVCGETRREGMKNDTTGRFTTRSTNRGPDLAPVSESVIWEIGHREPIRRPGAAISQAGLLEDARGY